MNGGIFMIMMVIEWIVAICLLLKFVPRNKIREGQLAFFFMQSITWIQGLIVAELSLVEYPIRLFPHATKTCFTFEYFAFPAISAVFNIHYPMEKGMIGKLMYYFYYCTTITVAEFFIEKYLNNLEYINWHWYITWITVCFSLYLTRRYYEWFFKLKQNNN